jgi:hypothetical protein
MWNRIYAELGCSTSRRKHLSQGMENWSERYGVTAVVSVDGS